MINRVILLGNLGKDPEVKHFDDNNVIANFSLATSESYTDRSGQKVTQTEWHNIAIRRTGLAKIAEQYLKKGDQVYIEGKIKQRSWDDKDGVKKYITEIQVENLRMLGKRSEGGNSSTSSSPSYSNAGNNNTSSMNQMEDPFANSTIEDDLPF